MLSNILIDLTLAYQLANAMRSEILRDSPTI